MTDQAAFVIEWDSNFPHSPSGFRYVVTRNDSETGGRMVDDILEPTMRGHAVIVRRLARLIRKEAGARDDYRVTVERLVMPGETESDQQGRPRDITERLAAGSQPGNVRQLIAESLSQMKATRTHGHRFNRQLVASDRAFFRKLREQVRRSNAARSPLPGSMTAAERSRLLADLRPMTFEGADLRDLDAACCLAASMCDDDATRQESLSDGDKLAARYARESRAQAKRFRALGERIGKHNAGVA